MKTPVDLTALASAARLNVQGKRFARLNGMTASVSRFSSHPRWEIHPNSDELLVGLAGDLKLTLLLAEGEVVTVLGPGQAWVIPRNTWHSPEPLGEVSILSLADYGDTDVSDAEDPR